MDLKLYAVTDRSWLSGRKLSRDVEESLLGGVTILQLREKNLSDKEFEMEALEMKSLCKKYKVPFIINDNVSLALKVDADGVHVGQDDMDAEDVRKIIGKDKILGVSAQTVDEAVLAEKNGADYLGVGAVFSTSTKKDASDVSLETLKAICNAVSIPVVAIGGINEGNIEKLKGSGIAGISVISAIYAEKDIRKASENLLEKVRGIL